MEVVFLKITSTRKFSPFSKQDLKMQPHGLKPMTSPDALEGGTLRVLSDYAPSEP